MANHRIAKSQPLQIGARVVVLLAPAQDRESYQVSEPTTIAGIQWLNPEGELSEVPTDRFQYLLDGEEPFADTAFGPDHVEAI